MDFIMNTGDVVAEDDFLHHERNFYPPSGRVRFGFYQWKSKMATENPPFMEDFLMEK